LAAMGMLLLIACCNVANLLLAQAAARRREMAVRLAVGAGRSRILRQLVVEGLLLCSMATVSGLVLARAGLGLLTTWLLPYMPALQSRPEMNIQVLCFSVLLSVLTGFVSGLAPALAASKSDMATAFKDTASASGFAHSRIVRVLVVAQA